MFFYAVPNVDASSNQNEKMMTFQTMLREQLENLTILMTLAEYLGGIRETGLDVRDQQTFLNKVEKITLQQANRYKIIDALINENILAMKKQKTTDQTVFLHGKEVRKMESALRTIKLFTCDVIAMLSPNSIESSRVEDRLSYIHNRAKSIEAEIKILQLRLNLL